MTIPVARYRRLIKTLGTLDKSLGMQKAGLEQERARAEAKIIELLESADRIADLYSQSTGLVRRVATLRDRVAQIDERVIRLIERIRRTKATLKKLDHYVALGDSEAEKKLLEDNISSHVERAILAPVRGPTEH